ncbi:hypothetical protein CCACVL1_23640, partial [Corchorus capsularis]
KEVVEAPYYSHEASNPTSKASPARL